MRIHKFIHHKCLKDRFSSLVKSLSLKTSGWVAFFHKGYGHNFAIYLICKSWSGHQWLLAIGAGHIKSWFSLFCSAYMQHSATAFCKCVLTQQKDLLIVHFDGFHECNQPLSAWYVSINALKIPVCSLMRLSVTYFSSVCCFLMVDVDFALKWSTNSVATPSYLL